MIVLIWTVVLATALYLYLRQTYSKFSSCGVKHLKIVPFFGNMFRIVSRKEHLADNFDTMYSKFFGERFVGRYEFMRPAILVLDLELAKNITIKNFEHFVDHRSLVDEKMEPLFTRVLLALKGQEWKDMRSTLSPAFTSSKIKLMVPFMEEVSEQMIRALKKKIDESKTGSVETDVKDLTSRFANDVIATCAFGLKTDSLSDGNNQFFEMGRAASTFKFRQLVIFCLMSVSPSLINILNLQLISDKIKNYFINLILNTMKDREARNIIRPDMIHLLMEAKKGKLSYEEKHEFDANKDAGFATVEESTIGKKAIDRVWSDNDLVAQAILFFIAGFDTISTAMSFALHELALYPDVQERLVQEIKEHDVKSGGKLNFSSIQSMTYMDMVVSESLRLWPPLLALDRICNKDFNLGKPNPGAIEDYIIRKGEVIGIPVWSFHRDPNFFPNPDKFDPERFSEDNKKNINPLAYMPFGVGPRNCIGSRFALCEIKVLLYQLLLHMEVSPSEKTCTSAKLAPDSFNPQLKGGHWLKFKLRS